MANEAVQGLAENDSAAITGRSVRLPQWLAMALIGWLFGSAYWAGTMSTRVENQTARIAAAEQQTELYRVEVQALRNDVARLSGIIAGRGQKGE
jgi:cell division protein FtsB